MSANLGYQEKNEVLRVEQFMRDYFIHATNIHQYSEIIFQRCIETRQTIKKMLSSFTKKNLGYGFHAYGGHLTSNAEDPSPIFKQNPSLIITALEQSQAHNLTPNYQIKRQIKKLNQLLEEVYFKKPTAT